MDGDEAAWAPARPAADRPGSVPEGGWSSSALPVGAARSVGALRSAGVTRPVRGSRPRRPRSPGRRLGTAYAILAVAIAVVTGLGLLAQPSYGSLAPYRGTAVSDLRSAPGPSGWRADLAHRFEPSVPGKCLYIQAGEVDSRHELVTATLPGATGQTALCNSTSISTSGRLIMLDPETGQTVWQRDLAIDLHSTVLSLVWHRDESAGAVVIGIVGTGGTLLIALDSDTGRTISRSDVSGRDAAINFAVSGGQVLTAEPDIGGTLVTYSLRRATDLSRVLWSEQVSAETLPQLLPDRLVVPLSSGTIAVDGRTGRVAEWSTDLRQIASVKVVGAGLMGVTIPQGVGLGSFVVRLDAAGRTLWEFPALDVSSLESSRSCITMTSVTSKLTCLDPHSGRPRWSVDFRGATAGTPVGSTTRDIEAIAQVGIGDTTLGISELDGDTGRTRFTTAIPRGAQVSAQSLGTGYALVDSTASGESELRGFDLSSGRALWTISAPTIERWGGRFVALSGDGVAHELVDGRATGRHDMLVG